MHRFSVVVLHKEKLLLLRSKLTMDLVFFPSKVRLVKKPSTLGIRNIRVGSYRNIYLISPPYFTMKVSGLKKK